MDAVLVLPLLMPYRKRLPQEFCLFCLACGAWRWQKLGLAQTPEHTQYLVMMPVIIAMLFSFAVVRFVGMGTGNKRLYIVGGVAMIAAMALKQLGQVKGALRPGILEFVEMCRVHLVGPSANEGVPQWIFFSVSV